MLKASDSVGLCTYRFELVYSRRRCGSVVSLRFRFLPVRRRIIVVIVKNLGIASAMFLLFSRFSSRPCSALDRIVVFWWEAGSYGDAVAAVIVVAAATAAAIPNPIEYYTTNTCYEQFVSRGTYYRNSSINTNENQIWCVIKVEYVVLGSITGSDYYICYIYHRPPRNSSVT